VFTSASIPEWYARLRKPTGTPPSWVFGPVWSFLYLTMAVACWLVWREGGWYAARVQLLIFSAQLVLNAAWSVIFFGLRLPGPAFAEITILWTAILATAVTFWRVSPLAGWMLSPYLAWVTYAARLNYLIWRLNS
jgi:tryptophan-rich sensory protein